jgi:hypothetical protein
MIIFLGAVLALTVATVWLFGAQRRKEITALGPAITVPNLGFTFTIRMPKGWERARSWEQVATLAYGQPLEPVLDGRSTRRDKQRRIFFIAIRPDASDEQELDLMKHLAKLWKRNYNYGGSFTFGPMGAPHFDSFGNEYREAVVAFRGQRSHLILMRYEQIKSQGRIFWCVMAGNTQLNEADRALLDAVVESFDLLENNI